MLLFRILIFKNFIGFSPLRIVLPGTVPEHLFQYFFPTLAVIMFLILKRTRFF
jgi:hypothetical protein